MSCQFPLYSKVQQIVFGWPLWYKQKINWGYDTDTLKKKKKSLGPAHEEFEVEKGNLACAVPESI